MKPLQSASMRCMVEVNVSAGRIKQSEIRVMSVECERVKGVNLAQGVCDTEVPQPVRRGATAAIESGLNQYTRLDGIPALRAAIANKLRDYNKVSVNPETELLVT